MKTLVEDEPEPQETSESTIDTQVIQKTETFWSFLKSFLGAIGHFTGRLYRSKALKAFNSQIMYGPEGKKKLKVCPRCGGHGVHSVTCPRFRG